MNRRPTDAELLEAAAYQGTLSRNDPDYHEDLETMAIVVSDVASKVASVNIVEGCDPHIEVRTNSPRNRPELIQTAQRMGQLFEAPVMRRATQEAPDGPSYRQPPKHTFYKDDRR